MLVWIRPRLGRSLAGLAAVFVAVDIGLMAFTSQLTETPTNDLLAGTTPIEKLMVATLPPGGRMVNYDPQTYSSYPGSPQGIPDLNIIPGLPSVSGYASIVNGNYEAATHTHEQDDLDIGQLSSGTLDRLDLREVVTVPEYFLVPLQSRRSPSTTSRRSPEGFGADPVLPRGYGADFNETAYPFYPRTAARLGTGHTSSWFFGESLSSRTPATLCSPAARPRDRWCGSGNPHGRRDDALGSAVPFPAGATTVSVTSRRVVPPSGSPSRSWPAHCPPSGWSSPWPESPTSSAVRCRRRWCPDRGSWPASPRAMPYSRCAGRPMPISATAAHGGDVPFDVRLEHDEVRADHSGRAGADDGHSFGGLGLRMEGDRVGQRRCRPRAIPVQRRRSRPTGPHPGRARRRDIPLPAAALARGVPAQPGCTGLAGVLLAVWLVRRRRRPHDGTEPVIRARPVPGCPRPSAEA